MILRKNRQIENLFHALSHSTETLAIAKLKICQCILMTGLPNLILTTDCFLYVCKPMVTFWARGLGCSIIPTQSQSEANLSVTGSIY